MVGLFEVVAVVNEVPERFQVCCKSRTHSCVERRHTVALINHPILSFGGDVELCKTKWVDLGFTHGCEPKL